MMMQRGIGLTCPPGQTPTNQYDGSVKCCGGPTLESDPCSFMNTPGYLATQAQAEQDAANGAAGEFSSTIADISNYPQNVQYSAIRCEQNPGQSFIDPMGIPVTCPSQGIQNLSGGFTSAFTIQQLAQMLSSTAPPIETPVNVVGSNIPASTIQSVAPSTNINSSVPQQTSLPSVLNSFVGGSGGSTTATPSTATGRTLDLSFLTNSSLISGIPNWMLLAGAAAALLILPNLGGRR